MYPKHNYFTRDWISCTWLWGSPSCSLFSWSSKRFRYQHRQVVGALAYVNCSTSYVASQGPYTPLTSHCIPRAGRMERWFYSYIFSVTDCFKDTSILENTLLKVFVPLAYALHTLMTLIHTPYLLQILHNYNALHQQHIYSREFKRRQYWTKKQLAIFNDSYTTSSAIGQKTVLKSSKSLCNDWQARSHLQECESLINQCVWLLLVCRPSGKGTVLGGSETASD